MNKVDEYILNQQPEIARIIEKIRAIILSSSPIITEKISYKIPFYYGYKQLCYINPAKKGIDLGFCRGFELSNVQGILEAKNRNTIKTITFNSVNDIKETILREIINEAVLLDELKKKKGHNTIYSK